MSDGIPAPTPAAPAVVAGLDGCRAGWVVVTVPLASAGPGAGEATVWVVPDVGDTVRELVSGRLTAAAIDIPIGLPAGDRRPVDAEARTLLGRRRRSVFPAPVRAVLAATTYGEACDISRARCGGKAVSRQLYGIVPKIREVDEMQSPIVQRRLVEMHPELSFATLAGNPMSHYKGTEDGVAERIHVLSAFFPEVGRFAAHPPAGAKVDDVLDAFVGAWTARRYAAGTHRQFGGEIDETGLRMEMVA